MGARGGAMIEPVQAVAKSRCPSTSRSSRLSTGPSLNRSSGSRWRSFVINSKQLARTGATARRAASSLTRFALLTISRRSATSRSSMPTLRLTARRDRLTRPFFSPAGPRRGGSGAGVISLRGPRFIAHRRSLICARCCSPTHRRMAILAMHPTADAMPESSLSAMISWSIEEFGTGRTLAAASRERVDVAAAIAFLGRVRGASRTGLHHGDDGCLCGAVFRAGQPWSQTSARGGFANDGHRRGEGAARADASLGGDCAGGRLARDRACDGYQRIRDDGIVLAAIRRDGVQLCRCLEYAREVQNCAAVDARDGAGSGHAAADGGRGNRDADVFRSRQRRIRVCRHDGGPGLRRAWTGSRARHERAGEARGCALGIGQFSATEAAEASR